MKTILRKSNKTAVKPPVAQRAIERLLAPFEKIAASSQYLLSKPFGEFENAGRSYKLSRYIFLGPEGGGDAIRIGIFATIHGDEPEGALALSRFVAALEQNPELAKGYILFIYPICNPTGFEDNTRHSRNGKDLNREFWKGSTEPEIRWLESEICLQGFDGIVTLHSDNTTHGIYGFVNGEVLSENLLEPALREAEQFLPRNRNRKIDGFPANKGIIYTCYEGVLRNITSLKPAPFEITFETPQDASLHRQVEAVHAGLQAILIEYRYLTAIAQNI